MEIVEMISSREIMLLGKFLKGLDDDMIMSFPSMIEANSDGKNLLHICTKMKSSMIMQMLIEEYKKVAIQKYMG